MGRNRFSFWRMALLFTALLVPRPAQAQQLTHTCKFNQGPRARQTIAYTSAQPIPVGSPCRDGAGSTGVAVPDNPNPQLTHTCKFDQGPRTGQTQVYPQSIPVGASCWDGVSSGGVTIPDKTSAPEPAKAPPQNSPRDSPREPNQPSPQPTQQSVQKQETQQQGPPGHDLTASPAPSEPSGKSGLVSKALSEAEAFKQVARFPNARYTFLLGMQIDTVLYGLRKASSEGDGDRASDENIGLVGGGAAQIGKFMKLPDAIGKDQWSVLCLDLANLMATSSTSRASKRWFYCPGAEAVFAKIFPPEPKHPWPDITEPGRSYANDKKSLPTNAPSFLVPGILGQVYSGNWNNVADDENTRNYLGSILREQIAKCPKLNSVDVTRAFLNYWAHFELKHQQKTMRDARSNDFGAVLQSIASGPLVASGHGSSLAIYDADLVIEKYGCDGQETRQLASNIVRLAQDRGDLAPDVPNNEFFRSQLSQLGSQSLISLKYSDQDSSSMRSLRKSCEDMFGSVSAIQESFCRCQAQMLVRSGIPQSELSGLQSKFDNDELDRFATNYLSYGQLKNACYN